MALEQMQAMPASSQVVVKFREGTGIRLRSGQLAVMASADASSFQNALNEFSIPATAIRKMHTRPEADLDAERTEGQQRSGRELADLNLYRRVPTPR
jgi:hypothetical protein